MHFTVDPHHEGNGIRVEVAAHGRSRSYLVAAATQQEFSRFYRDLAADYGTRKPQSLGSAADKPPQRLRWHPLLTRNIHPQILVGYGDPAVLRTDDGWWLVATSNDAPDAFPILHSPDLVRWEARGFIFPSGQQPGWAATGPGVADFWAPEMAQLADEYWAVFTARDHDNALAIGLARAPSPIGPWVDNGSPLVTGKPVDATGLGLDTAQTLSCGVIDSHLFVDANGDRYLFWKDDRNGIWPRALAMLISRLPELIERLFDGEADRRTAAFAAAIVGWTNAQRPMVRFFAMQPLIEAVLDNWQRVRSVLQGFGPAGIAIMDAMTTPIRAQRIADDGRSLIGNERTVLANDLEWEGHLIEGPFVTLQDGRYWLFYAGNDFSTPAYGIGVAVSDHPLGPYRKQGEPLLQSTPDWLGPGHASVAPGADGKPQLFFHAFPPGTGGYNQFRAVLTVGLRFAGDRVEPVELPSH